MPYDLYDYLLANGKNDLRSWAEGLQKEQRAKLNEKLDKLRLCGEELYPRMLTDTDERGILKLRVRGRVQLRPLLCRGPVNSKTEYTLLMGAQEKQDQLIPKGATSLAAVRKREVLADPANRRREHERVT